MLEYLATAGEESIVTIEAEDPRDVIILCLKCQHYLEVPAFNAPDEAFAHVAMCDGNVDVKQVADSLRELVPA